MTEQQADALMATIEVMTNPQLGPAHLYAEDLQALTALCRHRDRVVFTDLMLDMVPTEIWGMDWELRDRLDEMQTWEDLT